MWYNHFIYLLGNPPEITVSAISKITNRLNIETAMFTKYELLKAIHIIKHGKACGLDEIPIEIWKRNEFQDFLFIYFNVYVYYMNKIHLIYGVRVV